MYTDKYVENLFYQSINGTEILLVEPKSAEIINSLSKQGLNLSILIENKQFISNLSTKISEKTIKIYYGDIFNNEINVNNKFDTLIIQNSIADIKSSKRFLEQVFNNYLKETGTIILLFDTQLEWNSFIIPNLINHLDNCELIKKFEITSNKCLIALSKIKGTFVKIPEIIEKIEVVLTQTNNPMKSEEKLVNKNLNEQNITIIEEYNKILNDYNRVIKLNEEYRIISEGYKEKLNEIKETVRYRVGDAVVNSIKRPGFRTLKLPLVLVKLFKEGRKREKQRAIRKTKKTSNIRTPVKNNSENEGDFILEESPIIEKIKQTKIYQQQKAEKSFPQFKVACILDDFSYQCFEPETNIYQLTFDNWLNEIKSIQPDFLLVESAWLGHLESWRYQLINIQKKDSPEIVKLINYCKQNKIPTVFWNKEDPPNFDRFIETAKLFDYIFTTDVNMIDEYKKYVSHENIYPLPFAAQPTIHNPVGISTADKEKVAFAGTWYANRHYERQLDMNILLGPAREFDVNIFDRFFNYMENDNYKFPEVYRDYIVGKLDYEHMIKAYRLFKVFLNVNTVSNSSTMFARRVVEILASGTNIISTKSLALEELFPETVFITHNEDETRNYLEVLMNNEEILRRRSVKGIRTVYDNHLYQHRFEFILNKLGYNLNNDLDKGVSIVAATKRPSCLENLLNNYSSQSWPTKELIIVLNSRDFNLDNVREKTSNYENVTIVECYDKSLGFCLNKGIEKSKYEYIAKFDDDDYYGPDYVKDSMHAFTYSDASIVGKKSIFMYFENNNALALKYPNTENKYQDFVFGATLMFKKDVWRNSQFKDLNRGEDSNFLKDALSNGFKVFSTNPYNYTYIRQRTEHHTWVVNDFHLLRKSKIVGYMDDFKIHVTV